jgi:hypothetical protein
VCVCVCVVHIYVNSKYLCIPVTDSAPLVGEKNQKKYLHVQAPSLIAGGGRGGRAGGWEGGGREGEKEGGTGFVSR